MATVTFGSAGPGVGFDLNALSIGDLFLYDFTNLTSTVLRVFDDASNYTEFTGTGFAGTVSGGTLTNITAGTINSITFREGGVTLLSVTGLSISAVTLYDYYAANDTASARTLIFGGADTITGTAFADVIRGETGNDTVNPGGGADTIRWKQNDGFDTLNGDNLNQDIVALEGTFYDANWEYAGNDLLIGAAVDDNYDWNDVGGNIRIKNFFAGSDTIAYMSITTQFGDYDFGSGERLYFSAINGANQGNFQEVVIGTNAGEVMAGGGGVFDNLEGRAGNDTMSVSNGTRGNFFGGDGLDTMTGADQRDRFVGGNGADTINGNAGLDLVRYNRGGGSGSYTEGVFVNLSTVNETQIFETVSTTVNAGRAIDNWNNTDILSNIEDIHGSEFADVLIGSSAVNVIQGFQGDDLIKTNAGADTIVWQQGDGFDTVLGDNLNQDIIQLQGIFYDTEWQTDGNDLLVGGVIDDNYDFADSGGAIRIKNFFAGADSLAYVTAELSNNDFHYPYDGSGPIRVYFSAVTGTNQGAFEEEIIGTSGNDTMTGGGGAADNFFGGDGNDTITASNGTSSLLRGGNGTDTLTGADQDDRFRGGDGNDAINGQSGIDRVEYHRPSGSSDIIRGAFVNLSTVSRTFLFNSVSTTVAAGKALDNWLSTDTLSNIEEIRGSDFADILLGNVGDNFIEGRNGNDTIEGGDGDDDLRGGAGNDNLDGGNGDDDFIQGEAGNDTLNGGAGNSDTVSYYNSQSGVTVNLLAGTASDGFGGTDSLANFEEVLGSFFNDSITGGTGDDVIQGFAGSDFLDGDAGAGDAVDYHDDPNGVTVNLLTGTASDGYGDTDTLTNFEKVYGSFFDDDLAGDNSDNTIEGRAGNDTLDGGGGTFDTLSYWPDPAGVTVNLLAGTATDGFGDIDTIANFEHVLGSMFNDTITGDNLDNFFEGRGGNDILNGGGGLGDGVDYYGSPGGVTVNLLTGTASDGYGGTDTLSNFEQVYGSFSSDTLTGNGLANFLEGRDGDDTIIGGAGGDTMDGGGGTGDRLSYAGAAVGVTINLATNAASGGDAAGDIISGFENVTGGNGADSLTGEGGVNSLVGGGGKDTLDGGLGNDTMAGGASDDTYVAGAGDTITELLNEGYDIVNTSLASFTLGPNVERVNYTGAGNFVGTGNGLANRFQSGAGDDRFVDVAGGADIFSGGTGTDTVDFRSSATGAVLNFVTNAHGGAAAGDTFSGIEKFLGSNTATDTMTMGGTGRALFVGGGGNDALTGGIKNDQLLGQAGNDALIGGADRDSLDGGTGNDTMTGGAAGDVFVFIDAAFGQDSITDYEDGLDSFKVFSAVADNILDFTIANNNSTSVTLTLGGNTITVNGAAPIIIDAADFLFY